eukprot:jgi/Mesen1/9251/ME000006S09249
MVTCGSPLFASHIFSSQNLMSGAGMPGSSQSSPTPAISPCGACKFLRRKCTKTCIFAPHFPPDQGQRFANVHKVFGASNVAKLLQDIPVQNREDAVNSLSYEADARVSDPIYGCVGALFQLQQQVTRLQTDLAMAQAELARVHASSGHISHRGGGGILGALENAAGVGSTSSSTIKPDYSNDSSTMIRPSASFSQGPYDMGSLHPGILQQQQQQHQQHQQLQHSSMGGQGFMGAPRGGPQQMGLHHVGSPGQSGISTVRNITPSMQQQLMDLQQCATQQGSVHTSQQQLQQQQAQLGAPDAVDIQALARAILQGDK